MVGVRVILIRSLRMRILFLILRFAVMYVFFPFTFDFLQFGVGMEANFDSGLEVFGEVARVRVWRVRVRLMLGLIRERLHRLIGLLIVLRCISSDVELFEGWWIESVIPILVFRDFTVYMSWKAYCSFDLTTLVNKSIPFL